MNPEKPWFNEKLNKGPNEDVEWKQKYTERFYGVSAEEAERIEDDPRFREILEEALSLLQKRYLKYYANNYSGLAPSGYLLDREGKETNTLPSQNINIEYHALVELAKSKFSLYYPQSEKKYRPAT